MSYREKPVLSQEAALQLHKEALVVDSQIPTITLGGLSDVVSDTSPQLGGDLDILTYGITSSNTIMNSTISGTGKSLVFGF